MKRTLLSKVSLFLNRIIRIVGIFILTIFFFVTYFIHLTWEIFIRIATHDDDSLKEKGNTNEDEEEVFKFSYVRRLLKDQSAKQVGLILLTHAKEAALDMHKKFWQDLARALPFIIALLGVFLLFVISVLSGISTVIDSWILGLIGVALYVVFLVLLRSCFKKFLK
ncbi:MAG: hypothetical protein WCG98_01020 [bacterium]